MNKDCNTNLKTFDQNLLEFLTRIANINIENNKNNQQTEKIYTCCLAAQQIYFVWNLNYIGGFYFSLLNAFFVSSFNFFSLHGKDFKKAVFFLSFFLFFLYFFFIAQGSHNSDRGSNFQDSKNLKFWCLIFCVPCVDFWCTHAPQKNLAP